MQVVRTHQVAVNAFLLKDEHFLLLKRARKPLIWGPPGGRLFPDEDPHHGLMREVHEETGLKIKVCNPVITWFGDFNSTKLLSLDYLCLADHTKVILSSEHNEFRWLTLGELQTNSAIYFTPNLGFNLPDFNLAWRSYLIYQRRWEDLQQFEAFSNQ